MWLLSFLKQVIGSLVVRPSRRPLTASAAKDAGGLVFPALALSSGHGQSAEGDITATVLPVFTGQQIIPYTANAYGQTINSANSYVAAAAVAGSGTVTVLVKLAQTNQPSSPFQVYSLVDCGNGGGPVAFGDQFTTDSHGSGAVAFTLSGIAPGSHLLAIDINEVPLSGPGNTWYVSGSSTRIPFTC